VGAAAAVAWRAVALTVAAAPLLALAAAAAWAQQPATGQRTTPAKPGAGRHVLVARVGTIIHPVAATFVADAVERADDERAVALVLELDTPGGLLTSTRDITRALLQARTPVVVYVSPQGAQAASAGFFVLMAADVAAMAPGTNTGAAHPVAGDGADLPETIGKKAEQDAAAQVRSLAARHGRNVALAEAAVVESRSFTASEALEQKLVEVVAPDLPRLLQALDGRTVRKGEGPPLALHTAGAEVRRLEMGRVQRFLAAIAHPNIAYILLTLGFLGLYFELATPGVVLPGVVGAICLLLGFYALSVLPLDYTGVALLLLAGLLFLAEIKVTSYGLLTVAGLVSLVLGSLMLFESPDPALRVSVSLVAAVAAAAAVTVAFLMTLVLRAHKAPVATGREGLVGERGVARAALVPAGRVFVHGELWNAVADEPVAAGAPVEVVAVDGLTLRVRRAAPAAERLPEAAGALPRGG
jgi:membrane-bound serine protease (ClpP class)